MMSIDRRLVALLALVLILVTGVGFGAPAQAQIPYVSRFFQQLNQPRYAAIVVDANTGEVLYEKNPDSPRYPASITKVMTLYLTFEALASGKLSLSDRITISPHAASQSPSKLGLPAGSSITVDEAIRAIAVISANDIAVAMAEKLGGSESRFATLMTLRAQELGMTNSHFVNASGLPDSRQLMTARDIALLSRSVMRDFPQYYSYFSQHKILAHGREMPNHNHLLDSMPGVDGLKTGYTYASGFNLAASAVRDNRRLIAVVLGGSSTAARDLNVQDLLTTGFSVMRRRAQGENVTIAQNLFEPDASGPVLRPADEQGDADQSGLKIIMGDGSNRATATANDDQPPAFVRSGDVRSCGVMRIVRHRHGRRTAVLENRRCRGAQLIASSDLKPCKAHHGRKASCSAAKLSRVSSRRLIGVHHRFKASHRIGHAISHRGRRRG